MVKAFLFMNHQPTKDQNQQQQSVEEQTSSRGNQERSLRAAAAASGGGHTSNSGVMGHGLAEVLAGRLVAVAAAKEEHWVSDV
jgi:hypothetical protein